MGFPKSEPVCLVKDIHDSWSELVDTGRRVLRSVWRGDEPSRIKFAAAKAHAAVPRKKRILFTEKQGLVLGGSLVVPISVIIVLLVLTRWRCDAMLDEVLFVCVFSLRWFWSGICILNSLGELHSPTFLLGTPYFFFVWLSSNFAAIKSQILYLYDDRS
jgi:hypothetical protein